MDSTLPRGEVAFRSIPRFAPRSLRRRPLMLAAVLKLTNHFRSSGVAWVVVAVLIGVFAWIVTRPFAAAALEFASEGFEAAIASITASSPQR